MSGKNLDPIVFDDIEAISIPVTIAGRSLFLREASGGTVVKYRSALLKGMTLGADGKPSQVPNAADAEPVLVAGCLVDDKGVSVGETFVRNLPNKRMKVLFDRAKEISDVDEEVTIESLEKQIQKLQNQIIDIRDKETKLGNLPENTEDGSD